MQITETTERVLFGGLVLIGYIGAIGAAAYVPIAGTGPSHDIVVGAIGSLGTAVGVVVQSVFRVGPTGAAPQSAPAPDEKQ